MDNINKLFQNNVAIFKERSNTLIRDVSSNSLVEFRDRASIQDSINILDDALSFVNDRFNSVHETIQGIITQLILEINDNINYYITHKINKEVNMKI